MVYVLLIVTYSFQDRQIMSVILIAIPTSENLCYCVHAQEQVGYVLTSFDKGTASTPRSRYLLDPVEDLLSKVVW
jgi:hypothetical protein